MKLYVTGFAAFLWMLWAGCALGEFLPREVWWAFPLFLTILVAGNGVILHLGLNVWMNKE